MKYGGAKVWSFQTCKELALLCNFDTLGSKFYLYSMIVMISLNNETLTYVITLPFIKNTLGIVCNMRKST